MLAAEVSSRPGGELYAAAPFASADDADDEAVAWRLEQEERDEVDAAPPGDPPAHDPADWFQGGDSYSSTHSGATR